MLSSLSSFSSCVKIFYEGRKNILLGQFENTERATDKTKTALHCAKKAVIRETESMSWGTTPLAGVGELSGIGKAGADSGDGAGIA
jgi:hypothetical protein